MKLKTPAEIVEICRNNKGWVYMWTARDVERAAEIAQAEASGLLTKAIDAAALATETVAARDYGLARQKAWCDEAMEQNKTLARNLAARDRELATMAAETIEALKAAHAERDAAVAVLRDIEWAGDWHGSSVCPCCSADRGGPHTPKCGLATAIGAPREEPPPETAPPPPIDSGDVAG